MKMCGKWEMGSGKEGPPFYFILNKNEQSCKGSALVVMEGL
jgi:hypothetical protein